MRISLFFSLCMLLMGLPLGAQLDPRLKMGTDTLDGSMRGIQGNPEVITVLDFSGSMTAMVRHINCKLNVSESDQRVTFQAKDGTETMPLGTFTGQLTSGGATGTYQVSVRVPVISADGASGPLIAPNGEQVKPTLQSINGILDGAPFRSVGTSSGNEVVMLPNHQWWVRQASHARLTSAGKTIDIPIPWRIMGTPDNKAPYDAYVEDPNSGKRIYYEFKGKTDAETDAYELLKVGVKPEGGTIGSTAASVPGETNFSYQSTYFRWIFSQSDFDANTKPAFRNGLPNLSRAQAVKMAVLKTWVDVQKMVHWAYRYLDNQNSTEAGSITINGKNDEGSNSLRALRYLAPFTGDIPAAIIDLQKREPVGGTPLTYALANAYAQMMDGAVFRAAEANEPKDFKDIAECRKHYVILFTDGEANDQTPGNGPGNGDPFKLEKQNGPWLGSLGGLDPGSSNFNVWTLAGMAAHGSQVKEPNNAASGSWRTSSATGSASVSSYAPFGVRERTNAKFNPAHPIKTITVGMSLTENGDGKGALLRAAGYGHPKGYGGTGQQPSWDSSRFVGRFEPPGDGQVVDFFDTRDARQLVAALKQIFTSMGEETGCITAPAAPTAGLRSGGLTYMTTFKPSGSSVMWLGDLMMASMGEKKGQFVLLGKNGSELDASQSNPVWSASGVLKKMDWKNRKVYTYFSTKSISNPATNRHAKLDVDLTRSAQALSPDNADLLTYLGGDSEKRKKEIEWLCGNRPKEDKNNLTRMGDVVSSSPVSFEYIPELFGGTGLNPNPKNGERCRVVFVGTNHGFLHAFAEVSFPVRDKDGKITHYDARATELWSFMPKDFLKGVFEQLTSGSGDHVYSADKMRALFGSRDDYEGGTHAFMVDGPILGYLDEDHSTGGKAMVVDKPNGNSIKDRALIIFGLGKGGRSRYAIDVTDPVKPVLRWAIIPDDEEGNVGTINPTIGHMGLSTALPALASIDSAQQKSFKDLVFIGGGLSTEEIDNKFSASGSVVRLGRSVLAMEAVSGEIYQSWDFINDTALADFKSMGSVPAAPVPFDLLGTYTTQRVYFADRLGGVYALGANKRMENTGSNPGLRIDNSDPKRWTLSGSESSSLAVRKIWQAGPGETITTSPYPFLINFPGAPASKNKIVPAAVGVAVGTGDYWDPMDRDTLDPNGAGGTGNYRIAVLFDRQDSGALNYDKSGIPFDKLQEIAETTSDDIINPIKDNYFLKHNDGFFVKLKSGQPKGNVSAPGNGGGSSQFYYEKLLTDPFVQRGKGAGAFWTLWLNVFNPSVKFPPIFINNEWLCGGGGQTCTFRIHNVLRPKWSRNWLPKNDDHMSSGMLWHFQGIAGRITATGPNTVVVPGALTMDHGAAPKNAAAGGISMGKDEVPQGGPPIAPKSWRLVN